MSVLGCGKRSGLKYRVQFCFVQVVQLQGDQREKICQMLVRNIPELYPVCGKLANALLVEAIF